MALVVVVLAAVVAAACGSSDAASRPTTTTSKRAPAHQGLSADFPGLGSVDIAYEGGSVVATDAGVWVFPHLDPVGLRIDGETGEVDLEVALASYVTAAAGGDGMIWIRTENDEQSYTRLDPETGKVLARIPRVVADLPEVAFGYVWAAGADGTIHRIDPATNQVDRFPAQSAGAFFMAPAGPTLWTLGSDGLVGIDPQTGAATEPWRPIEVLGERAHFLATTGPNLLVATATAISEVDPVRRAKLRSVPTLPGLRPGGVVRTVEPGTPQLWWIFDAYVNAGPAVAIPRGETPSPVTIARIDLDTGAAEALGRAPFPEAHGTVVTADGTVWLSPLRATEVVFLRPR